MPYPPDAKDDFANWWLVVIGSTPLPLRKGTSLLVILAQETSQGGCL
jgi:hypothetical protein